MSNKKNILKKIISEVLLKEIGESNIPPLEFKKSTPFSYDFNILIGGEDVKVNVEFDKFEVGDTTWKLCFSPTLRHFKTYYNISYDVGGDNTQYSKTDMKTFLKMLSTVVTITKEFINNQNPDCLYIEGSDKGNNSDGKQKNTIYGAYILNQLNNIGGYSSITKGVGYNIYKIN